jgi:hypothetical protein
LSCKYVLGGLSSFSIASSTGDVAVSTVEAIASIPNGAVKAIDEVGSYTLEAVKNAVGGAQDAAISVVIDAVSTVKNALCSRFTKRDH